MSDACCIGSDQWMSHLSDMHSRTSSSRMLQTIDVSNVMKKKNWASHWGQKLFGVTTLFSLCAWLLSNTLCQGLRTPNGSHIFIIHTYQTFSRLGRSAKLVVRYLIVFLVALSAEILSRALYIPSLWFCIIKPCFLQKAKILQDILFGFVTGCREFGI